MVQLSEEFLAALGLGGLPRGGRDVLLSKVHQQLEVSVGLALSSSLSDEQLDEFTAFAEHDEARTIAWLEANEQCWPNPPGEDDTDMFNLASVKWLALHRPDYRQVVDDKLADIKLELLENRDAIRARFGGLAPTASD